MSLFITQLFENPRMFAAVLLLVVFSVCLHECLHAYAALLQGDSTAADRGHLTLNPLRQMGLFSLIALLLIGIAWGEVPVDRSRLRHRYSRALVALAGPAANLGLFVAFTLSAALLFRAGSSAGFAMTTLLNGAMLNAVLLLFNLLPVPGLDGWAVVDSFFPDGVRVGSEAVRGALFILMVLLVCGLPWLYRLGELLTGGLFRGCLAAFGGVTA